MPLSFFEENFNSIDWKSLCRNTNVPFTFFEKHLDKLDWYNLYVNKNIPESFWEKYIDKITKYGWSVILRNTNIHLSFIEKYANNANYDILYYNDFSEYFDNIELQETKSKMSFVLKDIENFVYSVPVNVISCLYKGGYGYLEVINKY